MSTVEALRAACEILSTESDPAAVASSLGQITNDSSSLLLVQPLDRRWQRIQVVVADERVDFLVLERAEGQRVPIAELVKAYGPPDPEDTPDGPVVLWFDPPDLSGCRIGATVRSSGNASRSTAELWVVAPRLHLGSARGSEGVETPQISTGPSSSGAAPA